MDQHLNGKSNGHYNGAVKAAPGQMQPHNIEAEEAVLGGCLIDIDAIISVSDFLTPADFFLTKHRWVFEVILHLFRQRKPVDMLLVNDELDRREQLEAIGGPPFLSDLANRVPTSLHTEYYGRIVERTSSLRRLITAGTQIVQLAHDDTGDLTDIQDQAGRAIFDALDSAVRRDFVTLAATMDAHIDRAEYLERNADALIALPTGLKSLDNLLGGGMFKGDLDILAGRPGMGKTSLALGIALQAAQRHAAKIAIFSVEMSKEQLGDRLVSAKSGINGQIVRSKRYTQDQWSQVFKATSALSDLPIFIDDTPAISMIELRTKARKLDAVHGLDLVIVDYLQLMRGDDKSRNREAEISYISRSLKELARELNVPVLALSQLNRSVESRADKRPMLSDLRESGAIEQDADIVLFAYRDDYYNPDTEFPNITEIIAAKHRNGPTGVVSAYFKRQTMEFVDLEVRREPLEYK